MQVDIQEGKTLYVWLQGKDEDHVPLLSGAHLFYSEPPSTTYCESMIKLHLPWRSLSEARVRQSNQGPCSLLALAARHTAHTCKVPGSLCGLAAPAR